MTLVFTAQPPNKTHTDQWRLITTFDLSGAENMALDEALLESVINGAAPVVRFYTWQPATLSLGVNQPTGEIDRYACEELGFGLVRRITGGRAVLHQHELTYSAIAPESDPRVSGGVIESYRKISAPLVAGLQALGANVELTAPNRAAFRAMSQARRYQNLSELEQSNHGAVCFDTASAYEISTGGRKLVGSAQARRGGALLQHGSILLDIDWQAWVSVFAYASEAGRQRALQKLPTRMTSLREELGRDVSAAQVRAALLKSFQQVLEIGLEESRLTQVEQAAAQRLAAEKYGSDTWTLHK